MPLSPAELTKLLRRQLRRGLRASRLLDCPELISFLCSNTQHTPDVSCHGNELHADIHGNLFDRALTAEEKLSEAISRIGGKPAEVLRILGGFDDGTVGLSLQQRRKLAGRLLGTKARSVSAATFVKNYELNLVRDLAVEVWRGRSPQSP